MSNNMKDRFVSSNFDEVDLVLDTDRRFEEAIAAADAGEEDLVDAIVKEMKESGAVNTVVEEEDVIEYNPEMDDADNLLDATAEDIREYVSDEDYMDEDEDLEKMVDDWIDKNPKFSSYDYDDED
jgi:hypothetical protein